MAAQEVVASKSGSGKKGDGNLWHNSLSKERFRFGDTPARQGWQKDRKSSPSYGLVMKNLDGDDGTPPADRRRRTGFRCDNRGSAKSRYR